MPKIKRKLSKKKGSKTRKVSSNGSITLYLIIGIIFAGMIYWFSKEDTNAETAMIEQRDEPEKETPKKQSSVKKNDISQKDGNLPSNLTSDEQKQECSLESAILLALRKLDVPETAVKRKKKEQQISFLVPIDRKKMDLTFANMIIKGEVEKIKGKLKSGTEKGNRQILVFSNEENNVCSVELFYDSKIYSTQEISKVIAIVVDDFGDISGDLLKGFLELDRNVTFAIFPDAPQSITTMQRAHQQGRETIIHVPMEPLNYPAVNPGKNAIFVTMSEKEIENRMTKFIEDMNHCKGANNHMGSLATTDEAIMTPVMKTLKKHGMYFIDSRTSNVSVAYNVAQKSHISAYKNDIFLDAPNLSNDNFEKKLAQVIEMGSSRSHVIAITHCHTKEHLAYLKKFIEQVKAAGFIIVPVSKIGQHNIPSIL